MGANPKSGSGVMRYALLLVGALGLAALLAYIPWRLGMAQTVLLEQRALDLDINRVVHAMRGEVAVMEDYARDWAVWDDSYAFVADKNAAYAKANLDWESLNGFNKLNLVAFLDAQGELVWGGFHRDVAHELPLPALPGRQGIVTQSGFMLTPEGPVVFSAQPILRSNGSGPPRGTLVLGRVFGEASLRRLVQRECIPFQVSDTLRMPPNSEEQARMERLWTGRYEVDYGKSIATIHALVQDVERRGGLWIQVPWARDIHIMGRRASLTIALSVFGALVAVGCALLAAFHWYQRAMHREREDLGTLVDLRTQELKAANEALAEANRALEEASMVDALTGLKNRRFVDFAMPADIARALRIRRAKENPPMNPPGIGEDMVFFLIDMDHFKSVNDVHGHAAGDGVLKDIGNLLKQVCRESDTVARWGGEEFLVIARRTHRAYAPVIAHKFLDAFRRNAFQLPDGTLIKKTCSIGFCPFPVVEASAGAIAWHQAVEMADLCLYAAKRSGRDGWVGLNPDSDVDAEALGLHIHSTFRALVREGRLGVQSSFPDGRTVQWW